MATALRERTTRDEHAPLRHVDWLLLVVVALLSAIGLAAIYSARRRTLDAAGLSRFTDIERQGIAMALGTVFMVVAALIDYRKLRDWALPLYLASLATLGGVILVGRTTNGSQAWFQLGGFQFQPSEFAKVALVLALAAVATSGRGHLGTQDLGACLMVAAVPVGLILLQPDLGTAMVLGAITIGLLLVAGAQPRHIAVLTLLGIVSAGLILGTGRLETYQQARLTAFIDQQGSAAYHLEQSMIAIGNGGATGRGYLQGVQANGSYVPEQHTDFIFTVVGEEFGFVGTCTLLALYGLLAWRIWRTAQLSRDITGTLICAGVLSMLVFQVFENIGMTMGIMPITGIPLPLLSYGGTATMATLIAVGLVQNVHMRRMAT
jgi:rod shape determining protein RodA